MRAAVTTDYLPVPEWRGFSECHVRCAAEEKSTRAWQNDGCKEAGLPKTAVGGGPEKNLWSERAPAQSVDGDAGGGGDDALDAKDDDRRPRGVKTKKTKDQGDKIRINGRNPSCWAGICEKR
jgi:hypothetical protein